MHWLLYFLGLTDPSGSHYLFWSGVGADLAELSVIGVAVVFYQHRKCISCLRMGKHYVEGTAWTTCHAHLTRECHDRLINEYRAKHPAQFEMLQSDRADSEQLIQP